MLTEHCCFLRRGVVLSSGVRKGAVLSTVVRLAAVLCIVCFYGEVWRFHLDGEFA